MQDEDDPNCQSSFQMTFFHEIGYVLGLGHSEIPSAMMYPWYQDKVTSLSSDDIMSLEYLYGVKQHTSSSTTVTFKADTGSR